jgi:uncharacterized protein YndB with AHSA1/START domain
MTVRSAAHTTFVVERTFEAAPARVFAAFADPKAKARWSCHDTWRQTEFDFRPGGREVNAGGEPGGPVYAFDGRYQDIIPSERIVFAYDMHRDDVRISVSVATIEFAPQDGGTRLVFTEHAVFLDGHESPALREQGAGHGLDNLADMLSGEDAAARPPPHQELP